jgi:hypothetical protein
LDEMREFRQKKRSQRMSLEKWLKNGLTIGHKDVKYFFKHCKKVRKVVKGVLWR